MRGLIATLAIVWRIASPYFRSEDRWAGRLLLAAVIAIELSIVGITVLLNAWNADFYNALQDKNWDAFVYQLGYFCVLAAAYIVLAVYQLYLNQWLQIRWRRWLTQRYLDHWLTAPTTIACSCWAMPPTTPTSASPKTSSNSSMAAPAVGILALGLGLLNSVVTLGSFVVILWTLSADGPACICSARSGRSPAIWSGPRCSTPCSAPSSPISIGWPLVSLNFQQQRYEADFRFNLVRVRENSEQIALLEGEPRGRDPPCSAASATSSPIGWLIMTRTKRLTFLTAGYAQVSTVFPFIVVSPAYFAGAVQLGGLMQTASAFGSVQNALSFFINVYRGLAEWRAVIERLDGFDQSVAAARARCGNAAGDRRDAGRRRQPSRSRIWRCGCRTACRWSTRNDISISLGDRVLVSGPSGSGQVDAVPGAGRHLAVRLRHRRWCRKTPR